MDIEVTKITEPSSDEGISALVRFVADYSREMVFTEHEVRGITLAMKEVCGNIAHWAYEDNGTGEIECSLSADENGNLFVTIEDRGQPFNMVLADAFPDVWDADKETVRPSMRLTKKAFKNVEYKRDANRNILVLVAMRALTPQMKR